MIGLLQRVTSASVSIDGERVAVIDQGLLVLVGVERDDTEAGAKRLCQRLLGYRVFADDEGRMNRSVADIEGGVLLVPQFTLPADTRKGTRPGFSAAADPELGKRLFDVLVDEFNNQYLPERIQCGRFGADMQVSLVNDGPVTFWLQVPSGS